MLYTRVLTSLKYVSAENARLAMGMPWYTYTIKYANMAQIISADPAMTYEYMSKLRDTCKYKSHKNATKITRNSLHWCHAPIGLASDLLVGVA
jgi:hypothetical protein